MAQLTPAPRKRSTTPIELPPGREHGTESGYAGDCGCTDETSPTGHGCSEAMLRAQNRRNADKRATRKAVVAGKNNAQLAERDARRAAKNVDGEQPAAPPVDQGGKSASDTPATPPPACQRPFEVIYPRERPCVDCGQPNGEHAGAPDLAAPPPKMRPLPSRPRGLPDA